MVGPASLCISLEFAHSMEINARAKRIYLSLSLSLSLSRSKGSEPVVSLPPLSLEGVLADR